MEKLNVNQIKAGVQLMVEPLESIEKTCTLVGGCDNYTRNDRTFFADDMHLCGQVVEVVSVDLNSLCEVEVMDGESTTWIACEFLQSMDEVIKEETAQGTFDGLNDGCSGCTCGDDYKGQACEEHHDKEFHKSF